MRKSMLKILSVALVLVMMAGTCATAFAAEVTSGTFRLPTVKERPVEAPELEMPEATDEPIDGEVVETPAEEVEEPFSSYGAYVVLGDETSSLNVRSAAVDGAVIGSLHHGDHVTVKGEENGWKLVSGAGVEGYVSGDYLKSSMPATEPEVEEPVVEPEAPVEEPTVEEPAVEPTEEPIVEETEAPAEEVVEEVVEEEAAEEEAAVVYTFERDENGALVLDESGNPVAIVPEGAEIPVTYLRDENGALVLDENGDPIVTATVPVDADKILTLADHLNPDRYIDVYISWAEGEAAVGNTATLIAVTYGYDNMVYSLQWQRSKDDANWTDVSGATSSRLTVVTTEENAYDYWRVQVIITDVKA